MSMFNRKVNIRERVKFRRLQGDPTGVCPFHPVRSVLAPNSIGQLQRCSLFAERCPVLFFLLARLASNLHPGESSFASPNSLSPVASFHNDSDFRCTSHQSQSVSPQCKCHCPGTYFIHCPVVIVVHSYRAGPTFRPKLVRVRLFLTLSMCLNCACVPFWQFQ